MKEPEAKAALSDRDVTNKESRRLVVWYYSAICAGTVLLIGILFVL